jgi:hypothetical protein
LAKPESYFSGERFPDRRQFRHVATVIQRDMRGQRAGVRA